MLVIAGHPAHSLPVGLIVNGAYLMRLSFLCLLAITTLAACGVDGEPIRPSLNAGVGVSDSGVHTNGRVGLHKGPFSVLFGF